MNVEVKGNAKTKIFSSFMDWIGDDMSQIKLIEYQTVYKPNWQYQRYMHIVHPSMCMAI